jgi:hypothetical protein
MVKRLASLESDKRKGISKCTAETLCTNLFGVATEHATEGTCLLVTPEASRDVANEFCRGRKEALLSVPNLSFNVNVIL